MIIHLKKYKEHGYLKAIRLIFFKVFFNNKYRLMQDTRTNYPLKGHGKYPGKKLDLEQKWNCTSCYLCSSICPTSCIDIQGEKNQGKLDVGKLPISFNLTLLNCTQCKLCVDVCPSAALDLEGVYSSSNFDKPINFIEINKN